MSNYRAYAGIGSRETPDNILRIMSHLARYLFTQGWTLRSGAADGADSAFEAGVDDQLAETMTNGQPYPTAKEIYLPWRGFNHSTSELHPGTIPFNQYEINVSARFHPAWEKCSPSARLLHQRNLRQIIGCEAVNGPQMTPVKFVMCWTKGGQPVGGTAQALRIAEAMSIPIINFGKATNPKELEALVLEADRIQTETGNAISSPRQ